MLSTLLVIVLVLLVAGVFVWAIRKAPGIDDTMKQYAIIVVYVGAALYTIYALYTIARNLPALR